jgi:hypothetical protein
MRDRRGENEVASSGRDNFAQIQFQRNLDVAGRRYQVTVSSLEDRIDTVVVDVLGMGPGGEATEGTLTVSVTALPYLGPLLNEVLGGVAQSYGVTVDDSLGTAKPARAKPVNAGQPWTDELRAELSQRWLAADPAQPAATALRTVAKDMGRTIDSIRSALQRLQLDPDRPGRRFGELG